MVGMTFILKMGVTFELKEAESNELGVKLSHFPTIFSHFLSKSGKTVENGWNDVNFHHQ